MIAWAVVRAMEKHAPFRRLILEDDQIVQNDDFDLGVAVRAGRRSPRNGGDHNCKSKELAGVRQCLQRDRIAATRGGRVDAMNAPGVITNSGRV